jgi:signal transduction histidine kinase
MRLETEMANEVDGILDAWRARMLTVFLIVLCVRIVFPGLACLAGYGIEAPWPFRLAIAVLCGVLVVDTLLFRADFWWRMYVMLVDVVVIGVLQLWMGQLAGDGRATLLLPPFLSLVLIGPRAGWVLLAICAALFAGVLQLTGAEGAMGSASLSEPHAAFKYWGLMWLVWVEQAVLLMLLLSLFVQRLRRTMINERQALRELEKSCAERQRLAQEVDRLGTMERRRLGAELHDGLCQHLTAIHLNCATLERRARDTGQIDVAEFKRIHGLVEEAIDMAYDVSRDLCPVDLDTDALVPALEQMCRKVQERQGLVCTLKADPELSVRDPECAVNLYRIAGEAVANAVKHAKCTRVVIELTHEFGQLVLCVTDNGSGRAVGGVSKGGLGLDIMAYRAELLGGSLEAGDAHGGGYRVTCRVPNRKESK